MLFFAIFIIGLTQAIDIKMRNGGPETFDSHRIPSAESEFEQEHSATFELHMIDVIHHLEWAKGLYCDSNERFAFSIYSPHFDELGLELTAPNGTVIDIWSKQKSDPWPINADGTVNAPGQHFLIDGGDLAVGQYNLRIKVETNTASSELLAKSRKDESIGLLIVFNDSPLSIVTHLTSYELEVGQPVGIRSHVTESSPSTQNAITGDSSVSNAEFIVISPDGTTSQYTMHDDGLHGDLLANDGVFGATFVPTDAGQYLWFSQMSGTSPTTDRLYQRTTEHLVRIASSDATITGSATLGSASGRLEAEIEITRSCSAAVDVHVYAELWHTASAAQSPTGGAVAYAATIVSLSAAGSNKAVVSWDARWLTAAGIDADVASSSDFVLRNVYISEMDGFVPISHLDVVQFTAPASNAADVLDLATLKSDAAARHPDEQIFGVRPAWIDHRVAKQTADASVAAATHKLVLLHGYCSSTNPFTTTASVWTDFVVFEDFGKSRGNNDFALKVVEFAENLGLLSFSFVGHSQGGIVAVHLLSNYWSGADVTRLRQQQTYGYEAVLSAAAPPIIQSVGTPYHGCSGAGSAASLIKSFGVGCGANTDLTIDGAELWLATISESVFPNVAYYTTTAKKVSKKKRAGGWFGTYCSFATSLVLDAPNDGTTEFKRAHLDGARNMGNTVKECHVIDMNYPSQTSNAARNLKMNTNAAR